MRTRADEMWRRRTYDLEAAALVWRVLGPIKRPNEVKWTVIYEVDRDLGRLVVLAICHELSSSTAASPERRMCVPAISLFTRRRRASILSYSG